MGIYRNMLRTIRQVPDEADRKYLKDWARDEFKRNKSATNQVNRTDGSSVFTLLVFLVLRPPPCD